MTENDNEISRKQIIIIGVLVSVVICVAFLYYFFLSGRIKNSTKQDHSINNLEPSQVVFLLQKKLNLTPLPKPTSIYPPETNISDKPQGGNSNQPTTSPQSSTGVRESDIENLTNPSSEQVKATNQERELKSLAPFKTGNYKLEFDYSIDKFVVTLNKPEDIGYRELQDMLREYFPNIPLDKFKYIFKNSIVDYNAIGKKDNKPTSNPIEEYRSGQVSTLNEIIVNIAKINEKYADGTIVVADTPTPTSGVSPTSLPGPTIVVQPQPTISQANTTITPTVINSNDFTTTLVNSAKRCLSNLSIYQEAMDATGVSWQVLAGIHYVEGGCSANKSLVSGRTIGIVEPDVGNNCSSIKSRLGEPRHNGSGCIFDTLLDTAVYAGRHLSGKISKVPQSLPELAKASSLYNGGGNSNCRPNTPYKWCPPAFQGEDDIHPMSYFEGDVKCEKDRSNKFCMYLRYCNDGKLCPVPKPWYNPGTLTIAKILGLPI